MWSDVGTFRRRLPVPAPRPENPTVGGTIPLLTWTPVEGAISYDVHVDMVSGNTKDFTYQSTAFSPTVFYGSGIWHWSVRANFPTLRTTPTSGSYFPAQPFARRVDIPTGARGSVGRKAMLLTWNPVDGAQKYRVEISRSNGFVRRVESIETETTAWAPLMLRADYAQRGLFYWRVAALDEGRNLGGWSQGTFALGKALEIRVSGHAEAGRRSPLHDHRRQPPRQARARRAGARPRPRRRRPQPHRACRHDERAGAREPRGAACCSPPASRGYAKAQFTLQVR